MTPGEVRPCPANIERDKKTVAAMVRIYCHDQHGTGGRLCGSCRTLLTYAEARLTNCPFGAQKTTCARCPIHCYRPAERAAMKTVMHHAGPRMLLRHPVLALRHVWLERQPPPSRPARPPAGTAPRGDAA